MGWTLTALSESGGGEGLERIQDAARIFAPASSVTISHGQISPFLLLDAWLRDAALQSH